MAELNIGTSVHFIPVHLHPYYRKRFALKRGMFPETEYIYDRIVSLPLYPGMTKQEVAHVAHSTADILTKG
jgi:dTDP-4-amino-4,6-dideoxygalactose transaminase